MSVPPAAEPQARPWRALAVALAWYIGAAIAGVPFVLLENAWRLPASMGIALVALVVPAVLLLAVLRSGQVVALLRPPIVAPMRVVAAVVLVLLANNVMLFLFPVAVAKAAGVPTSWAVVQLTAIAFAAPVAEELFFRGWLWDRLSRAWSPGVVAVVTGAAFALAHAEFAASVLPLTVALSWLRLRDGTLRAPLALHLLMNTMVAAVTLLRLSG